MKILLLAHPYLNLYKVILEELQLQGHDVVYVKDLNLPGDPFNKTEKKIKNIVLKRIWQIKKTPQRYWSKCLSESVLNESYDLLFVIQGYSFDITLLNHLRKYNPNIKSSLYIWDSNRTYDFFRNIKYFDIVYSFDYADVLGSKNVKVQFLPFFWPKELCELVDTKPVYKISSIGTNHHGRYYIYKKIIGNLELLGFSYYIKLILYPNKEKIFRKLIAYWNLLLGSSDEKELYRISNGRMQSDFVENKFYSPYDLCKIMAQSESVLDTDNEMQFGTTPRLIWALALNKHIYTTNSNVVNFSFYNSDYIHIIDRSNPLIDFNYLDKSVDSQSSVENLRIDKWVKKFL